MWEYSDKVKEHFFNPRNAGALEGANAVGEVGSLSCGDALKLMLKVDPETDVIEEATFQTFGCGSAIASSSALTELIIGKTIQQARSLTNQDIADYLDGLPPEKMHCSVMGQEALTAAVAAWTGEAVDEDDHEEGALICKCFGVDAGMIERAIRTNALTTLEMVTFYTKAGGGCNSCREPLEELLADTNAAMVEEGLLAAADAYVFGSVPKPKKPKPKGFVIPDQPVVPVATVPAQPSAPVQIALPTMAAPAVAAPAVAPKTAAPTPTPVVAIAPVQASAPAAAPARAPAPAAPPVQASAPAAAPAPAPAPVTEPSPSGMSAAKEAIIVARIIEDMRHIFKADGGNVELVDMDGSIVQVHLTGTCAGCQIAALTLGGLQKKIRDALGRPVRIMPVAQN